MTDTENEIIEKFLNHDLSEKEMQEFYERLRNDDDLGDKLTIEVVRSYNRVKLKEQLEEIDRNLHNAKIKRLNILRIAASVVIILGIGVFFWTILDKHHPKEIISKNTNPKENKSIEKASPAEQKKTKTPLKDNAANAIAVVPEITQKAIVTDELIKNFYAPYEEEQYRSLDDPMSKAIKYYELNNYDSAMFHFEKVLKTFHDAEKIDLALFYYANTYLAKGITLNDANSLTKAKKYFSQFIRDPEFAYRNPSYWYLSMVYLKENKPDSAVIVLHKLVKHKDFKYQQATKILELLK
jgi:tetratricopeptide (TPR) repeat protein